MYWQYFGANKKDLVPGPELVLKCPPPKLNDGNFGTFGGENRVGLCVVVDGGGLLGWCW